MLHRSRELLTRQRTQTINARTLAALGLVAPTGHEGKTLRAIIADAVTDASLRSPAAYLPRPHRRSRPGSATAT